MAAFIETETARDLVWSTACAPFGRPLREWTVAISEGIAEMDVMSQAAERFSARWRRYGLGTLDLNFLEASPQRVIRSGAIVARTATADFDLLFIRRGEATVTHCGEALVVADGTFVLVDNQKPYELSFRADSDCLTAHFNEQWLRKWIPHPGDLVARPVSAAAAWSMPLAAMLDTISAHGLKDAALPRAMIADQLGGLLALMAGKPTPVASRYHGDILSRLRRELRDRLEEHDLDPAEIARSADISKRHLHGLFAAAGTTFGATLIELRLERAATMLTDPRYRAYRMGDVAWACGFTDPSHFARRFRKRFGAAPLSYRHKKT